MTPEEQRKYSRDYYKNNKERILKKQKQWEKENPEKIIASRKKYKSKSKHLAKQWYDKNKEKRSEQEKIRRNGPKREEILAKKREYSKDLKVRKRNNIRAKERKQNDIQFRIKYNLRNRMNIAIKNNSKSGSAVRDLGCSIEEFKLYLEAKFQEGMTWDNWSRDGWNIDHIIPLSSFDLTNREQFLKAAHHSNLQPLWAKDNRKKGDRI
jgi:hypothetical protein